MASIVLLQRDPRTGSHAFTGLLVDIRGVGLKDGFTRYAVSRQYLAQQVEKLNNHHPYDEVEYVDCSLDLLRQLVWGGILWARQHNFKTPSIALKVVDSVLGQMPDEPAELDLSIFGGDDGRPLIIGSFESLAQFLGQPK